MDSGETLELISKVFQSQGVDNDTVTKLRGLADAASGDLTARGRIRIQTLLFNYRQPLFNKVSFKQYLLGRKEDFEFGETTKTRLRNMIESVTKSKSAHPPFLDACKCPDIRDTIEKVDFKTYGIDPFVDISGRRPPKRLLVSDQEPEWKHFKNKCIVEVGDIENGATKNKKIILSLTIENVILECQERGYSIENVGRLLLDILKQVVPEMAGKINAHSEVTKEIFKNLDSVIDLEREIKVVEESLNAVKRSVGEPIQLCGNNYESKQNILARLRSSGANDDIKEIRSKCSMVTFMQCLELVTPEVKNEILNVSLRKYSSLGTSFDLNSLYREVNMLESKHPAWRIKTDMYCQSRGLSVLPAVPAGNIFKIECDQSPEEEEDDDELNEDDEFEEEEPEKKPPPKPRQSRRMAPGPICHKRRKQRPQVSKKGEPVMDESSATLLGYCASCGDTEHETRRCHRYGAGFSHKVCIHCQDHNMEYPLFHPSSLCRFNPDSGYKSPDDRSPDSLFRYGFNKAGRRLGSPTHPRK